MESLEIKFERVEQEKEEVAQAADDFMNKI